MTTKPRPATTITVQTPDGWAASCRGFCGTTEVDGCESEEAARELAKGFGWVRGVCPKCRERNQVR